jgi:uncharacterized phage-associated protein
VACEEIDMPYQPRFNEQKTTEATAIFLDLNGGKMNYMKLLKLLYLTDRKAFKKWERPITYDSYVSMKFGPVLSSTYDLIKASFAGSKYWGNTIATEKYEVILKDKPPKIKKLSQAEIDLIKEIFKDYGKHSISLLSRITHSLPEYRDPPYGSSIPIPMGSLLEALNYNTKDIQRIFSELQEEASITETFGT